MGSYRQRGRFFVAVASWALLSAVPHDAEAQAWLPAPGEGTVSIQWQSVLS